MFDWSAGYVSSIGYTHGYYHELNPQRLALAFLNAGLDYPHVVSACELGFGQGVSINLHAASSPIEWHGTDFLPSHAVHAREFAGASRASVALFDDSFQEFADREGLPDFDYIALHGVWSWISDENRRVIVDFLKRKLKVGGVLYISYNAQPAWAAMMPMRQLLTEYTEVLVAAGLPIAARIDSSIEFADKLLAIKPAYANANPQIKDRIHKMKAQERSYLAHEYFNRDWQPMSFIEMERWLRPAKLSYACSANYLEHVDAINLTQEQALFLSEITDPTFRQFVRDIIVNQQFRKDYWIKGPCRLSPPERMERLRAQPVILATHHTNVSLKVGGALGEANMTDSIYNPILAALADHQPKTLEEIEAAISNVGINFSQLLQAVFILIGKNDVVPVTTDVTEQNVFTTASAFNKFILEKSRWSGDIGYMASPVTGGGVTVNRFQQLFLLSQSQGKTRPQEWPQYVWEIISAQGQKLLKEGKSLETPEENLLELTAQAQEFATKQLPILQALRIA